MRRLPPSQLEYTLISSENTYKWLSTGSGGCIPPDQDAILWDRSQDPPRVVWLYVEVKAVLKRLFNSVVYQGSVESLTLREPCAVIDEFLRNFDLTHNPDKTLALVQAQPSFLRALLDTKAAGNFQHLRVKVFGHAVLRVAATQAYPRRMMGFLFRD